MTVSAVKGNYKLFVDCEASGQVIGETVAQARIRGRTTGATVWEGGLHRSRSWHNAYDAAWDEGAEQLETMAP